VDRIKSDLRPELFMELARKFTDYVGLASPRLKHIFEACDKERVPCAMAMFGEVAFSLVEKNTAQNIVKIFELAAPGHKAVTVGVQEKSANLVKIHK